MRRHLRWPQSEPLRRRRKRLEEMTKAETNKGRGKLETFQGSQFVEKAREPGGDPTPPLARDQRHPAPRRR